MDAPKIILFLALLVIPFISATTSIVDFCVADFNYPVGPAGYPCRNPANVTVDDFVFSAMRVGGNTTNIFGVGVVPAVDVTFPALNGLGLSIIRLDLSVGGVVPIHSHRVSEVILAIEGTILAGFIGSDGTPYYKTLTKGDIMMFPPTLLHFQVNIGDTPATAFVSLNSQNPGAQVTTLALATNDLPTDVIQKITLLDTAQIKKLKDIFGGTN